MAVHIVRDYGLEESVVGVYDELWEASDAGREHISQWRDHKPIIQLWDGDGYTNEWRIENDEIVESDPR